VIPDPLNQPGGLVVGHPVPRFGIDGHAQPRDGYTLEGFLWDQVYPEATPDNLLIVGVNFHLSTAIGRSDFKKLYRADLQRAAKPYPFNSYTGYGLSSLVLSWERLQQWRRIRQLEESLVDDVSAWLAVEEIASLESSISLEALNSNAPISDYLIDASGDLLILQGDVRPSPLFLLRRIGTTLAETVDERLSLAGIDGLLATEWQETLMESRQPFLVIADIESSINADQLDFTGPYGVYYREIFFHIPYLIANHLNAKQRFAASQRWYHYIFNPTAAEIIPDGLDAETLKQATRDRNWRYLEFRNQTLPKLRNMLTGDEAQAAIEVYKKDPFNPHAIARLRISAYQKSIVMKYIDNLLDWGDSLFAQFTRESINEAMLLYVMAQDILGERPVELGECGEGGISPKSFEIKSALEDLIPSVGKKPIPVPGRVVHPINGAGRT
jgi:hypothetical protein